MVILHRRNLDMQSSAGFLYTERGVIDLHVIHIRRLSFRLLVFYAPKGGASSGYYLNLGNFLVTSKTSCIRRYYDPKMSLLVYTVTDTGWMNSLFHI